MPVAHARSVAQSIPKTVMATIDDSGHLPHEEREAEVLDVIRAFLSARNSGSNVPSGCVPSR